MAAIAVPRRSVAAAVLAACLALGGPAAAQDKTAELKISSWLPPAHPLTAAFEAWGRSIAEASKGTIRPRVFPAQQLGKAQDHYAMARDGAAAVTLVNPGAGPGRFPVIEAAALPFLADNAKDGSAAIDSWYRPYAAKEMKEVRFCLAFVHDPGAWHAKRKIVAPADVKGLRVRPAHAMVAGLVTQLGGTNVQASAPEVRELLDRGAADAVAFPWGSVLLFRIDRAVKYHMDMPLYVTPFALVVSRAAYDGMSGAQQQVMDDHCTSEWAKRIAAPWADDEAAGRETLRKLGDREVYKPGDEQAAQWRKAAAPLTAQWARTVRKAGWNPDEVLDGLRASLARHNAAAK